MKTTIILLLLFSCRESSDKYILYPDSTNYEYKLLNNGLLKVIRFFPNTKDTSNIYFFNKNKLRDSISYYFDIDGNLSSTVKYKNGNNIKLLTYFYKNGNIKNECKFYKDKFVVGDDKYYYKNGNLKAIKEYLLYKDSIQYLNNELYYDDSGDINKDSSFYFKLLTKKDTVSLNDSLRVGFNIIKPKHTRIFAFYGSIENYFGKKLPPESLVLKDTVFYFKPRKKGINLIEVVIVAGFEQNKYSKVFLKKKIFVTE
ncbi:MAG: hypothetical protein GXO80_03065 [Chlorobi bacterium]|nr:hypothetical protein [Chlorobiota bacterium]